MAGYYLSFQRKKNRPLFLSPTTFPIFISMYTSLWICLAFATPFHYVSNPLKCYRDYMLCECVDPNGSLLHSFCCWSFSVTYALYDGIYVFHVLFGCFRLSISISKDYFNVIFYKSLSLCSITFSVFISQPFFHFY